MEESKATELRDSRAQQRDVIIRLKKKGDRREQKKDEGVGARKFPEKRPFENTSSTSIGL